MTVHLSKREAQVVAFVARGVPDKVIAQELGVSIRTVHAHVQSAANKVPGDSNPRHRLTLFFFQIEADKEAL